MNSLQVLFGFICSCLAVFQPNLQPPTGGSGSSPSLASWSGTAVQPIWSSFLWNATGSWQGVGTIQDQILYPFRVLNPAAPNYIGVDTEHKQIKYNFTVGGSQKTNESGTWITFAPGGTCFFVKNWTYDIQIQAYAYTTLKYNHNGVGVWTGEVEDISSCSTTVANTFLTHLNRPFQWNFAGGYEIAGLGSVLFDYQLTYDTILSGVPPLTNKTYWDVDASCYNAATSSDQLCRSLFPDGCTSFLKGYKPTSAAPDCNCTSC